MAKKKSFVLRIDQDVYNAVERWAAQEFRSANGQLEWIINKALRDARQTTASNNLDTTENKNEPI